MTYFYLSGTPIDGLHDAQIHLGQLSELLTTLLLADRRNSGEKLEMHDSAISGLCRPGCMKLASYKWRECFVSKYSGLLRLKQPTFLKKKGPLFSVTTCR